MTTINPTAVYAATAQYDEITSANASVGSPFNLSAGGSFSWVNYQRDITTCEWVRFVFEVILAPIVAIAGLTGNTLSTITLWSERKSSPTAFLLIALAFVDDLVVLGWTTAKTLTKVCFVIQTVTCATFMRYYYTMSIIYLWSVNSLTHLMSTYLTVLVTAQRYVSVSWPMQAKLWNNMKNVRIALVLTLLGSLVFSAPLFIAYYVVWDDNGVPSPVTREWAQTKSYTVGYMIVILYTVYYIVPVTFLIFATYKLITFLKASRQRKESMTSKTKQEEDITTLLIAVVIVFIILQVMNPIRRVMLEFYTVTEQRTCGGLYDVWSTMSSFAVVLNSSCNFIIYSVCSRRIRKQLIKLLRCPRRISPSDVTTQGSPADAPTSRTQPGVLTQTREV